MHWEQPIQPSMDEIMGELAITFEGSRWRYAGAT